MIKQIKNGVIKLTKNPKLLIITFYYVILCFITYIYLLLCFFIVIFVTVLIAFGENMTGLEYQYIRKFNKVSQIDVAKKLGYKSNSQISMIESETVVADRLIHALADLTGISVKNLLDDQWVAGYCEKIPENYKKPKFFRSKSIWV